MKDYKYLYGRFVFYKDVSCRVLAFPQNRFMDFFEIIPSRSIDDIGAGKGIKIKLSPLEFEVEVILDMTPLLKRES